MTVSSLLFVCDAIWAVCAFVVSSLLAVVDAELAVDGSSALDLATSALCLVCLSMGLMAEPALLVTCSELWGFTALSIADLAAKAGLLRHEGLLLSCPGGL